MDKEMKPGTMQIFVKTLDGKSSTFRVTPNHTVLELKKMIQEKEGVPAKEQRLIYSAKQLIDERKLKEYHIQKESTINLVMRLRGGL